MRPAASFFCLVTLLLTAGCDEGAPTEQDYLVGTWRVQQVEDATGDQTVNFQKSITSQEFVFEERGGFLFELDYKAKDDVRLRGSYRVDESARTIRLEPEGVTPAQMGYILDSAELAMFTLTEADANRLFKSSYSGAVNLIVSKQ